MLMLQFISVNQFLKLVYLRNNSQYIIFIDIKTLLKEIIIEVCPRTI